MNTVELESPVARTRRLNDEMRQTLMSGVGLEAYGTTMVTNGVSNAGAAFVAQALKAVAEYTAFDGDNDPYDEHDFGAFNINATELYWKVDYYDRTLNFHSEDKSDREATTRVLTIMLASEY